MKHPIFINNIFRDIDSMSIDFIKHKKYVISRVLHYGSRDDFLALVDYYGYHTLQQEILSINNLSIRIINFLCFYFNLERHQFACYTKKQSTTIWWNC